MPGLISFLSDAPEGQQNFFAGDSRDLDDTRARAREEDRDGARGVVAARSLCPRVHYTYSRTGYGGVVRQPPSRAMPVPPTGEGLELPAGRGHRRQGHVERFPELCRRPHSSNGAPLGEVGRSAVA